MKILQINKFFYRRGGAEQHMFDLIDLLEKNGHTAVPFASRHPLNEPSIYSGEFVAGADLSEVSWRSALLAPRVLYNFEAKRKLTNLIRLTRPDIAHAHLIYHHLSPSVLVALQKAKIPVVMTIHDWKPLCPNYLLYTENAPCTRCSDRQYIHATHHRCIKNKFWPSILSSFEAYFHHNRRYYEDYIDHLIAPSNFARDMFINFGWSADKITILPHFLTPEIKIAEVAEEASARAPEFAYVGRLSPEKGVKELVEYWIRAKVPYALHIFGEGPLYDFINALCLNSGNIFMAGRFKRAELFNQLNRFTAVIIPSVFFETFGLVAMEALAAGVPVIAHRRGALPEIVTASKAGLLFDWSEAGTSLRLALDEMIKKRAIFSHHATQYMKHHHQSESYYKALMAIYQKLLTK
ncbi:MAG: glycosyltransferase [Candidatus Magasanikbacteria bacterium]|nr:glycosyltransferase [Candidatus Magasanikbacteria bacterium]